MPEENSNSQNVNHTIISCQRGASQGSYRIFLEDGSSFFLSVDFFLNNQIRKDLEITTELYQEIENESLFVEAYIKAISLLSRQMYTVYKLKVKLISKGFVEDGVNRAIDYLLDQGYINDENYAQNWIESRINNKLDSYISLYSGLINSGISGSIAKSKLNQLYTEEVEDEILEKSILKYKNIDKDKLILKLYRKGFAQKKILNKINKLE